MTQRRAVRKAHARLHLYDVGWRRNATQVFGTAGPKRRWRAWAAKLLWGGHWYVRLPVFSFPGERIRSLILDAWRCDGSSGTGTQFPHNPQAEDVLVELAAELVRLERLEYDHDAD
jgi:palmitoyltransferase ZDHHC2/15/20